MAMRHFARLRPARRIAAEVVRLEQTTPPPLAWTSAASTYVICTNPRSGSWLLSDGLAATSLAGNPREWFNILEEQIHRARWRMEHASDLSLPDFLDLAKAESTTANGIAGVKLHYYQFAALPTKLGAIAQFRGLTSAEVMARLFPNARYLWLTRRDKARQAISFLLAADTDQWWNIDGVRPEHAARTLAPRFDPSAIARLERTLRDNDAGWRTFFEDNRIAPLVVYYEDLAGDYAGTIVRVLDWLGVRGAKPVEIAPTRLRRQATALNEEWLERYEAFKKQHPESDQSSPETRDALAEQTQRALERVPNAWKQWIAQSLLLKASDDEIVDVLLRNGYSRAAATAEVRNAAADPYLAGGARLLQRLDKAAALLTIQGQLARLDSRARTIERRANLRRDEFRDRYYSANRPVIIRDLMTGWKAVTGWTPDYLKSVAGTAPVEVMTGRDADPHHEVNGRRHRTELTFADYVDMVCSGKVTNDYYMVANNGFLQRPQAQPLLRDIVPLPDFLDPARCPRQCFLWFGPAGTVTRLHHDTSNILLAQVVGRKRYRMIPPAQWHYVYNSAGVFADVDGENPDIARHPRFRHASVVDVVVGPGEALFMPVGWWHHVRALDVSMTVAFTNFVFPNTFAWEHAT
jgi:LPS sulfotransferase NodH